MSFVSVVFLLFLCFYFVFSAVLPKKAWPATALVFSSIFYGYWDWRFLFLIWGLSILAWYSGIKIAGASEDRIRKRWVSISVIGALSVLGIFKYFNFFMETFQDITAAMGVPLNPAVMSIVLPVGISFYTFQSLSYTIDLYRKEIEKPAGLLNVLVYLSFFPQLVAGPIVRAKIFLPQIERGPILSLKKIKLGVLLIVWGYFLKLCLADFIALVVDPVFAYPEIRSNADLFIALVGYSFQIYGDFAGYSLIAIGIAKLQGFDFPSNFWAPYFSKSFSEFWRRWHISLSSWLRDYLYISLGGNRVAKWKEYRNLLLTMLLGGLWHGASYNFLVWGGLHGVYLVVQRALSRGGKRRMNFLDVPAKGFLSLVDGAIRMLAVYLLTLLTWVFFRIRDFDDALSYIANIVIWRGSSSASVSLKFEFLQMVLVIFFVVMVDAFFLHRRRLVKFLKTNIVLPLSVAFLVVCIQVFGAFGGGAFIYFQF